MIPGGSVAGTSLGYKLLQDAGLSGSDTGFVLGVQSIGSAVVLNLLLWIGLVITVPLHGFRPLYALAELGTDGELELLPAGDTQPLFSDRELAASVVDSLADRNDGLCVVPVWPEYAWRRTVAFHAAWGSTAEPRNVFRVDDAEFDVPVEAVVDELRGGYAETLRLRAVADDPSRLERIETLVEPQTTTDRIRAWIDDEIHDPTGA